MWIFLYYAITESDEACKILNQCSSNLALEICIKDVTKLHMLCYCHDNPFAAGPVLIKYEIPSCGLAKDHLLHSV